MRCCLTLSLCRTCGGLWLFVSLIASCKELWWIVVRWLWKFSKLTLYLSISTGFLSTEQYSHTWNIFYTRIFCCLLYDGFPSSSEVGQYTEGTVMSYSMKQFYCCKSWEGAEHYCATVFLRCWYHHSHCQRCVRVCVCVKTLFWCTFLVTSMHMEIFKDTFLIFHGPQHCCDIGQTLSGWWVLVSTPYTAVCSIIFM